MKPERWQQASRILEIALERDPGHRQAYLDEACLDDDGLRREVESLLAASDQGGSLLDTPAMKLAAPLFVNDSIESMLGKSIGRYKIITALGAGGMGEVYLAHDTRLDRKIALKLLPLHVTTDKDRLRRFEQEAHAASTLSHPNVCVIHEVGETENGRPYIEMEYVEGVTLRQHLADAPLKPAEALDVAIQVASALTATHGAWIVHRDIKPENIMVRSDGIIKVLDFGLAKLSEQRRSPDSELATRAPVQTDTGMVMGTTTYMSPEQARGVVVDARTDLWSLGVVLYEMLAGRPPFQGETASDLIAAILKNDPPPLTFDAPNVSHELEQLIRKALQKDCGTRHQTAGDLLNDLKDIKQELEFQAKLERSVQPEARDQAKIETVSGRAKPQTDRVQTVHTDEDALGQKISSAEYLFSEIKQHKLGLLITLTLLLGVGTLTYGFYRFARPHRSDGHFQNWNKRRFTSLTTVGNATDAAVSPDGKFVVYVKRENGEYSLWRKAVSTDSAVEIVPPAEAIRMSNLTFSPDGNDLYYTLKETKGPDVLYQVNVLGGIPKKVRTRDFDSPITFSPDGKQFALVEQTDGTQLIVINTDGTGERILASRSGDLSFSGGGPSWSPDGKTIATGTFMAGNARPIMMVAVSVASGEVKLLSQQSWINLGRVEWFKDGSGLVLTAQEKPADKMQVWQLSYPGGEVHRITNDLDGYGSVSVTTDSGALVTTRTRMSSNIWVAPNGDASHARQLTFRGEAVEGSAGVAWTPDKRIVYSSKAAGAYSNIWIMNGDGGNPRQLTNTPSNDWFPAVSPNGRYIVFTSNLSGKPNLWRMDMDGGNPKQLSNGLAYAPEFSPDGLYVTCMFGEHGNMTIWKFPVDGSSPMQLTKTPGAAPTVSWDSRLIAYDAYDDEAEKKTKVVIIPSDGGAAVKVLDYTPMWNSGLQWSPDDKSITFVNIHQGGANLWQLPLDGGPPQQLTDFKSEQIFNFHFTPDGRQLVCARGTITSDVVMISESN